jgi:formyl-CoA transferase
MDKLDIQHFKLRIPDIDVADLSERIKRPDRHERSLELIKIFDEIFAGKDLAEWRQILDGNGLMFGVVSILDDIPNDRQMIENE